MNLERSSLFSEGYTTCILKGSLSQGGGGQLENTITSLSFYNWLFEIDLFWFFCSKKVSNDLFIALQTMIYRKYAAVVDSMKDGEGKRFS